MIAMELHVEVRGGSIIVTLPGSSYSVNYCMSLGDLLAELHAGSLQHCQAARAARCGWKFELDFPERLVGFGPTTFFCGLC
jgi:hypothetical protein